MTFLIILIRLVLNVCNLCLASSYAYGIKDLKLEKQYKKQRNYCTKVIKNAVREITGKSITSASSGKEIWNSINDILRPERLAKTSIKIQTENQVIEDPQQISDAFSVFFKEKVEKLVASVVKDPDIDPFAKLREKLKGSNLKFDLKTVSEKVVRNLLKSLKPKKSSGIDGISSEILKISSEVLVIPLTYIVNCSLTTKKLQASLVAGGSRNDLGKSCGSPN